jgi:hypothetical protein
MAISPRNHRNGVGEFPRRRRIRLILSFFPLAFNTIPMYDGYSFAANVMELRTSDSACSPSAALAPSGARYGNYLSSPAVGQNETGFPGSER